MKKKYQFFILVSLLFSISCNTPQKEQIDQINNSLIALKNELNKTQEISLKSTSPRFQIIQSTIAARGTYKVDTYEGNVYQLVLDHNNNETWQLLRRLGNNNIDKQVAGQRNYEMFLSSIAMKFTYLINLNTGCTWQLVEDSTTKEILFSSFGE